MDAEQKKLYRMLHRLEKKAEANPKAMVRINRLAKKYDVVLKRLAEIAVANNPVGVRR